jgi:hypothetical protein
MNSYDFEVSLRIKHPYKDADEICNKLKMKPQYKWSIGELRNLDGKVINIINENTYCSFEFKRSRNMKSLNNFLKQCNIKISKYKELFDEIIKTGGSLEYFIGWYSNKKNSGELFDLELLSKLAELKIELSIDFYERDDTYVPRGHPKE